jgi:hypothetical protein
MLTWSPGGSDFPTDPGEPFSVQILTLLRSCGLGSVAGLNRDERIAQAVVVPDSDVDIEIVWSNFAVISRMHAMWADRNPGIRVVSRPMCALLARCLLHRELLDASDLGWLQDVTGEQPNIKHDT